MASGAAQFRPGQSGCPGGRPPKTKPFAEALKTELEKAGDDERALREIASTLIAEARSGNLQAIKEIADRLGGKPAQALQIDATVSMSHEEWLDELDG